jgi:hypothetical protein
MALADKISDALKDYYSPEQIDNILDWDNSVFYSTSNWVSWEVNDILNISQDEALENIKQCLKDDFWIESHYELEYLNPEKFIQKYWENQTIFSCFKVLTWLDLSIEWLSKWWFHHKQLNKAIQQLKSRLNLPEKNLEYFKNGLLTNLWLLGIDCRHTYKMRWSRYVDKQYKWDFKQRILCKKIFWKPRLKDVPLHIIFETLWIEYKNEDHYKIKAKQELNHYFWTFQEYITNKSVTHEENLREINKDGIYVKYFFHHVLQNTTWNLTKEDFEKLFVWSWYKHYTNKQVQEANSNVYIKNILSKIQISDLYSWIKLPLWEFKKLISFNENSKIHIKKLTWKPIHLFNFEDYLSLLENIFPEWLNIEHIKTICVNRIKLLWFHNEEQIRQNFKSDRQRRKFFYEKWNEVFGYIFQRLINTNPKLARANKWWDMSQITHEDIDRFIKFLEL